MSTFIIKFIFIFLLIVPLAISGQNGQSEKHLNLKGVVYKANVDAPLTSSEMAKIKEVYQESTQKQILDHPIRVKHLKHLLRNRIRIIKIDIKAKQKPCQLLSEIDLFNDYNKDLKRDQPFNKKDFNPLKYSFKFFEPIPIMYRVDGSNYYIQIQSQFQ
jgi:hypothetical protein